jgi:hypothetical protein
MRKKMFLALDKYIQNYEFAIYDYLFMATVERYQWDGIKVAVCLSIEAFRAAWLRIMLSLKKQRNHWAVGTPTVPSNRRQPITYGPGV